MEKNVIKNISWMALSMALPNLLNLAFSMVAARILLNTGYNDYDAVIGFVSIFALMSDLGLTSVFVRDVAKDRSKLNLFFGSYFTLRLLLSIGFIASGVLLASELGLYEPRILGYIYIAAISQLLFQVAQIYTGPFQATERMKYITIGTIAQTVVYITLGFVFIEHGIGNMGVVGLLYANLISNAVMLLLYAWFIRRTEVTTRRIEFNLDVWKYFKDYSIWFALISVFNVLYGYIDRVMVSLIKFNDVANYTRSYTLVSSLTFVSVAYVYVAFPLFSRIGQGHSQAKYAYGQSIKFLTMFILPICVGTTLLADRIIYTIYGDTFSGAIPVLMILIWILAFMIVNTVGSPILSSTHREKILMLNLAACTVGNIVLNYLLVPQYGAVGASIASLLTVGALNALITLYFIRDDLKGINILGPLGRILASALIMGVAVYLIDLNNLLLSVIMGAVVYSIAIVLTGAFSRDDIDLVIGLLKRTEIIDDTSKDVTQ